MPARRAADPAHTRAVVLALENWLRDDAQPAPQRDELGTAVRLTARTLAALAPGRSVEVRIPPFVAVQCISGPQHRRGTPPNVVETDPRTWLLLASGLLSVADASSAGALTLSGARAGEIAEWLPLVDLQKCHGRHDC
jgi:Bacterial SCP ortholog